jgi:hypothetical protein
MKYARLVVALGMATVAGIVLSGYMFYHVQFFILGGGLGVGEVAGYLAIPCAIAAFTAIYTILAGRAKKLRGSTVAAGFLIAGFIIAIPCAAIGYLSNTFLADQDNLGVLSTLYNNQAEWTTRANAIRQGILTGAQLVPLPDRTPMNPVTHDNQTFGKYSVENVYFECVPGFYISGNLYRPTWGNPNDSKPVILIPHGHFPLGRFDPDNQEAAATFARMGAYVMLYDMVGWGESNQVPVTSRFTLMLDTWDSVRVVDFLLTLPGADPTRVGVTGASGGGTQTILLAAVDSRIAVAAPVVMVSAAYMGGPETDEIGMPIRETQGCWTNNVEIAALMAPKPLLLVSDGHDWTRDTPTVEYPFIQRIYGFYGATSNVSNVHLANEVHDFGPSKRDAVYSFFAAHLGLNISKVEFPNGSIDETPNVMLPESSMLAFTSDYPRPANALQGEAAVLQAFTNAQHGAPHVLTNNWVYETVLLIVVLEAAVAGLAILHRKKPIG